MKLTEWKQLEVGDVIAQLSGAEGYYNPEDRFLITKRSGMGTVYNFEVLVIRDSIDGYARRNEIFKFSKYKNYIKVC